MMKLRFIRLINLSCSDINSGVFFASLCFNVHTSSLSPDTHPVQAAAAAAAQADVPGGAGEDQPVV